jgi:hypothetical protein
MGSKEQREKQIARRKGKLRVEKGHTKEESDQSPCRPCLEANLGLALIRLIAPCDRFRLAAFGLISG